MVKESKETLVKNERSVAETVLMIRNLYKSFGNNHVLIDFNLALKKGESVVVLGKSGSGKSVLIKCLVVLVSADKGELNVFGIDMTKLNDQQLNAV